MMRAPSVSADLVRLLLKYAAAQNLKLPAVLGSLDNPAERVSLEQFSTLWDGIALASGDPDFGLHFGAFFRTPPEGGIVFSVMMNCQSLGDAMQKLARYHGLMSDAVKLHLTAEDAGAFYTLESAAPGIMLDRHYAEAMLCGLVLTLRYLTEEQVNVDAVRFSHARPESLTEQARIFQCPLFFNQPRNELVIRREDLNLPIFLANPVLLQQLEALAQDMLDQIATNAVWTERVGYLLGKMLLGGRKTSLETVAAGLAMSPRNVQNKLRAEGTTYRQLLEQLRRETALRYLQDPEVPLCDIAFLLGFSDQSAFTNAFKRWTGSSPHAFRRAQE